MKKLIAAAAVMAALIVCATPVFAAPAEQEPEQRPTRTEQLEERLSRIDERQSANAAKKEELASKMDEFDEFRQSLAQGRIGAMDNREQNMALTEENTRQRLAIANALSAIKQSGSLPEETVVQLKDYNAQLKEIIAAIKDTKGDIRAVADANRENIKNKDYAAMDSAFAEIYTIQTWRNEQLAQMNTILQQMNALLSQTNA